MAEGRGQEDLEEVSFCAEIVWPLLRAQGQKDLQGLGLSRHV